jgi:hypothetical protein
MRSSIVESIAEMSRNRGVTHILISPATFKEYSISITKKHSDSGIRRSTCHGIGVLVVDDMADDVIVTVDAARSMNGSALLQSVRSERFDETLDIIDDMFDEEEKFINIAQWGEQ